PYQPPMTAALPIPRHGPPPPKAAPLPYTTLSRSPPGGGVPAGSSITSAAFTHTAELFDSWRRTWSFQRPESTAVVPVGKNQLYVPPGTDFPGVMLSVVPV